jgi:hypothetical protein
MFGDTFRPTLDKGSLIELRLRWGEWALYADGPLLYESWAEVNVQIDRTMNT